MKKFIHLHIPKSAGSSFNKSLEYQFGTFAKIKGHFNYSYEINKDHLEFAAIAGHIDMKAVKKVFPSPNQVELVTFLRDPVDRLISGYYNVKRDPSNPAHERVKDMSLLEYVSSDVMPDLDNGQVRRLSSLGSRDEDHTGRAVGHQDLRDAFENIRNYNIQIGISERFDDSLLRISEYFGWKSPRYIRVNKGKNREINTSYSEYTKVVEDILERNYFDAALYNYATSMNDLSGRITPLRKASFLLLNKVHYVNNLPQMIKTKYFR